MMLHNSMSSSNRSVDIDCFHLFDFGSVLSASNFLFMALYIFKILFQSFTLFRANAMRFIFNMSTYHVVIQCFYTVGWAMLPVKIVPEVTHYVYYCMLNPTPPYSPSVIFYSCEISLTNTPPT